MNAGRTVEEMTMETGRCTGDSSRDGVGGRLHDRIEVLLAGITLSKLLLVCHIIANRRCADICCPGRLLFRVLSG